MKFAPIHILGEAARAKEEIPSPFLCFKEALQTRLEMAGALLEGRGSTSLFCVVL